MGLQCAVAFRTVRDAGMLIVGLQGIQLPEELLLAGVQLLIEMQGMQLLAWLCPLQSAAACRGTVRAGANKKTSNQATDTVSSVLMFVFCIPRRSI